MSARVPDLLKASWPFLLPLLLPSLPSTFLTVTYLSRLALVSPLHLFGFFYVFEGLVDRDRVRNTAAAF